MSLVSYVNIQNEQTVEAFKTVHSRYERLHAVNLILRKTTVKGSTMVAQPIITLKGLFTTLDTYKIQIATYVRDSQNLKVDELPQNVLVGWFAHEMGHVVDYLERSTFGMIGYGIKYLSFPKFKRKVEHRADEIAIEHGFYKEILATKKFLLTHDLIDQKYKDKINKYYMSVDDANEYIKKNVHLHQTP